MVFACAFPACRPAIPPAGQPQQRTILLWEARAPAFHLVAPAGYRIDASGFHGSLSVAGGLARSGRGLGVYVGNYPGLLLPQRRDKPKVSTVAGTVAGQRVTWACWQEPPRRVVCETTTSGLIPETSELHAQCGPRILAKSIEGSKQSRAKNRRLSTRVSQLASAFICG
jgi:hypothetical protein